LSQNAASDIDDEDEDGEVRPNRIWLWGMRLVLVALGLFVGLFLPYVWYLDKQVRTEFAQLQWQVPTRVYARPLQLRSGIRLNPEAFEIELASAGYHNDGIGANPGSFRRDDSRYRLTTRAFNDMDGAVPSRHLDVQLSGGRVLQLRDGVTHKRIDAARVDPARIATLYGISEEERRLVRLEDVPELLITGLQSVEDRNFKNHHGIDPMGVARAIWVNMREAGFEQGASTLTQQMVRSLFLSNTKTITRKLKEALYALIIEARFDKRAIMEAYLNDVYLGQNGPQSIRGVAAASDFWFGRDLKTLKTEDIALLVGIIQGPGYWNPRKYPERAIHRRRVVLDVFVETGLISKEEGERAKGAPLGVSEKPGVARDRAPAFLELMKKQLARDYPADQLSGAGVTVMSTLAPSVQVLSERAVAKVLPAVQRKQGPELQAGMVVTDTGSGAVLALIGNRNVGEHGNFNRALQAQRPVGSLLKPFVYLLALAQPDRFSLASWVDDSPVEVTQPNGKPWRPKNSDGKSHGTVTLTSALARSYNQATVRVGMQVGPDRLSELLKVLAGLKVAPNPSLILGAVDLNVMSMTQLYQFLASGGRIQPLRAVRGVLDQKGKAISRYDDKTEPAQEGDAIAARLVTLALQSTVTSGTAHPLLADGLAPLQSAGKTGTSNDSRDSWYAGYTGDRLAVIWVGNDQNKPTGLYGATGAMKVWSALYTHMPTEPLRVPSQGIEWAWLDPSQYATTEAECPGARRAAFVSGYLPAEHRSCQNSSWTDWFHLGGDGEQPPPQDAPPPETAPAPPPPSEPPTQ
jgi:penicillin-binding protein 1B